MVEDVYALRYTNYQLLQTKYDSGGGLPMFGNDEGQQQPTNNFGSVSLPPQQPATPQFIPPAAPSAFPSAPPVDPIQGLPDLSIPELPATGTPDPIPAPNQPYAAPAEQSPTAVPDDLASLKQNALTQLTPLVGHLDQTPEEKFRTTMMMIQAADDQSLIKTAYEAAQGIQDEKARAQALLDVINEINYFTQRNQQN